MKLRTHTFDLPLRHTFTISRESVDVQRTLIVELDDGEHRGYGEATENTYYDVTIDSMRRSLDRVTELTESVDRVDPAAFWEDAAPLVDDGFALCALDQAAHDLWGKQLNRRVFELWGLDSENLPRSSFTIGIDAIDVMVAKLQEAPGWPIYKIKLGTDQDLEIIEELRRHTDAVLRVDANCGWTVDQAIELSAALADLGVEFLEQPLPAEDREGAARLFRESRLSVIADESCIVEADVDRCAGHFHGINIKLVKCGGLTPARRMIERARQLDLKVMVGCMTESTVGASAIAQLLPLLDYVDMDGPALLASDIAEGVRLEHGVCTYSEAPGHGVELLATVQ